MPSALCMEISQIGFWAAFQKIEFENSPYVRNLSLAILGLNNRLIDLYFATAQRPRLHENVQRRSADVLGAVVLLEKVGADFGLRILFLNVFPRPSTSYKKLLIFAKDLNNILILYQIDPKKPSEMDLEDKKSLVKRLSRIIYEILLWVETHSELSLRELAILRHKIVDQQQFEFDRNNWTGLFDEEPVEFDEVYYRYLDLFKF